MFLKSIIITICIFFHFINAFSQNKSIHQIQNEKFLRYKYTEYQWDSVNNYTQKKHFKYKRDTTNILNKIVFGWHPYWMGSSYHDYDFFLLSDIAYFSYEVNPNNGSYYDIHDWKTTALITEAQEFGTRISLTVTLFSNHALLLENTENQQNLIDSLILLVQLRGADGVNIDFEAMPGSQSENFTGFMIALTEKFHTTIPNSIISVAIPAIDWNNTFDIEILNQFVDLFIIMGYDYHWPSSPDAGPVSPKNNGTLWTALDITRSINKYLEAGISPSKLCLGVPYYGYDWPTIDNSFSSQTTGSATARTYSQATSLSENFGRKWDEHSSTPYLMYKSANQWRQCWFDDEESLKMKYDLVIMKNMAGIGIWALGYDGNSENLWNILNQKFTDNAYSSDYGMFSDMGGPKGKYFNNENYIYTIKPKNADTLIVIFNEFNIGTSDTLLIFDGSDTSSNKIGSYSGTNNPEEIYANNSSITFFFKSNEETTEDGWIAYWSINPDSIPNRIFTKYNKNTFKIDVYPNPFSNEIFISGNFKNNPVKEIQLLDITGNLIFSKQLNRYSQSELLFIDFKKINLINGIYLLVLKSEKGLLINQIVYLKR
ncbi:MAG: T9SS type A sorting domain-containing protein [Bacteroidales bacterium]|nr:T9SS type A sorting domain-containing protein [Bacteroidales bacterium]